MQYLDDYSTQAWVKASTLPGLVADRLRAASKDEAGQTTAEYVAVIVLIAAIIAGLTANDGIRNAIIEAVTAAFTNVKDQVSGP